jgi:hypothetical protein
MRDRSGTRSVAVMMMLRVVVSLIVAVVCVAMCCRRVAAQRFCWRATTVTSMWCDGLCRRPAAMRDRSGTMSVAVMMLRVLVFVVVAVMCMAMCRRRVATQRFCWRA